ncbi:MAG: AAA family ATPase, partial [Nitratireductor sp.]
MDIGLTTLREEDIQKHISTAQSLVTKTSVIEAAKSKSKTELAGTRRRFVQTVNTAGARSARNVEFAKTLSNITKGDQLLSVAQHNVLFKTRRAFAVALAVGDLFAKQTGLDALQKKNTSAPLQGDDAEQFRSLLEASSYVVAFSACAYLKQMLDTQGEAKSDIEPPNFDFSTPQDALKGLVSALESAASTSDDDAALMMMILGSVDEAIGDLLTRKARFTSLGAFENVHLRLESDGFELNGFDTAPGTKSKPLVMQFKKPNEIIGNHIAKYQAMKQAKMLMAYDFDRQL